MPTTVKIIPTDKLIQTYLLMPYKVSWICQIRKLLEAYFPFVAVGPHIVPGRTLRQPNNFVAYPWTPEQLEKHGKVLGVLLHWANIQFARDPQSFSENWEHITILDFRNVLEITPFVRLVNPCEP